MESEKLMLVWGMVYYCVFTLLLFSDFTMGAGVTLEADTSESQVHEVDRGIDELSRARSAQQGSNEGLNSAASTMAPTVLGRALCTTCMSVNTPLVGVTAELLCPHPPPGGGGEGPEMGMTTMVQVSTTLTAEDGSFHLTPNSSYHHIMNRCAVIISKSSDSNCDMPPPTGSSLPVSILSTSSSDAAELSGPQVIPQYYSLGSISFHPASCSVHKTKSVDAVGKPRKLLQYGEDPLGMDQDDSQKNRNHESTKKPISGSDPHVGDEEETAVVVAPHHIIQPRSQSHHKHPDKTMKLTPSAAINLPPFPEKPWKKPMHARGTSSVLKSLMMLIPSNPHLPNVHTNGHRHSHGGRSPPTLSTDRRHRHGGGPPLSDDSETNK